MIKILDSDWLRPKAQNLFSHEKYQNFKHYSLIGNILYIHINIVYLLKISVSIATKCQTYRFN